MLLLWLLLQVRATTRINAQTVKCGRLPLALPLALSLWISKVVLADDVVVVAEYFNLADSQWDEERQGREEREGSCLSLLQISNKSNICAVFLIGQKCNKIERERERKRERDCSWRALQAPSCSCNKMLATATNSKMQRWLSKSIMAIIYTWKQTKREREGERMHSKCKCKHKHDNNWI